MNNTLKRIYFSLMTPQALVVLRHLKRAGSISQREAIVDYSVQSLTRRITELRDNGVEIESEQRKHPTTGQRYVRYVLKTPVSALAAV